MKTTELNGHDQPIKKSKYPLYAKAAIFITGLYFFISILYIGQDIILPVIYAGISAILLSPAVNWLQRKNMNRVLAITLVLGISILIVVTLVVALSSQVSLLIDALPQLTEKFHQLFRGTVKWASGFLNVGEPKIDQWVIFAKREAMANSSGAIGLTLTTISSLLTTIFITPVYIFMLLYYQPHLLTFTHQLFGNSPKVGEILTETKTIVQSYLVGLFLEFCILAILNSLGLLILGIDYAIILGIVGALLNVIPYLGGLIGVVLFMMVALVTKSPEYVLFVMTLYVCIQLIDNNYIVPKIVGSKVKLNALISLFTVIVGAALWGIPGMFLSIPLTAIVKLICDRIDSVKSWGFLLGDTMPPLLKPLTISKKSI